MNKDVHFQAYRDILKDLWSEYNLNKLGYVNQRKTRPIYRRM